MDIYVVNCNGCGFHLDFGTGLTMYVINDRGERILCLHPGEFYTVLKVLGEDASDSLIKQRTGHLQKWLCLECLQTCSLDLNRDPHKCSHCASANGKFVNGMIDQPCPKCSAGTIERFDTGLIT